MEALVILLSCLMGTSLGSSIRNASYRICENRRLESNMTSYREVTSLIKCGVECLKDNTTNSANFIKSSKTCELYEDVLSQTQCDRHARSEDTALIIKRNPCKNNQPFDGTSCICSPPLNGTYCEQGTPKDCEDTGQLGFFDIYPDDGMGKIRVFCLAFRLVVFAAPQNGFTLEYYNKTWQEYKYGFGDMSAADRDAIGAYWLGNENIRRITNGALSYKLRYRFKNPTSNVYYSDHYPFKIDSETENYKMHYNTFNGEPEHRMLNGTSFSAIDRNDKTCAAANGVGYWLDSACSKKPPLFGIFYESGTIENYSTFWAFLRRM